MRLFSGTAGNRGFSDRLGAMGGVGRGGVIDLTLPADKKGKRTADEQTAGQRTGARPSHIAAESSGRRPTPSSEIGSALRRVYDGALGEDIPPEMLDLLGKLG